MKANLRELISAKTRHQSKPTAKPSNIEVTKYTEGHRGICVKKESQVRAQEGLCFYTLMTSPAARSSLESQHDSHYPEVQPQHSAVIKRNPKIRHDADHPQYEPYPE